MAVRGFPWARLAFGQTDGPLLRLAALGGAPLVTFAVASSDTDAATVSPSSVTFGSCSDTRTVTVTADPGTHGQVNLTVDVSPGGPTSETAFAARASSPRALRRAASRAASSSCAVCSLMSCPLVGWVED